MTGQRVRIGVIGVGFGATVHLPAFQSEGVEVVAVCSQRAERAAKAAQDFHIPHAFTDHREMLKLPGLDAVSIVTPPATHCQIALDALAAGKHVLCEKPFAPNQSQAEQMLEAAQRTGLTAMIAHEFRFSPGRTLVKELLDQGYLGRLNLAHISLFVGPRQGVRPRPMSWGSEAASGGGFLFALGSHYVDCLRHWFGEVFAVSGRVATHYPQRTLPGSDSLVASDADDAFSFTVLFQQGGWATMTANSVAPFGSGARIELYGDGGALVTPQPGVNPPSNGVVLGARIGDQALAELPMPPRLRPFVDERDDRLLPFRLEVREFLRGIREGTSPAPSFYDGYRCQQVLDAVLESSRTGRQMDIPLHRTGPSQ